MRSDSEERERDQTSNVCPKKNPWKSQIPWSLRIMGSQN